MDNSTDFDKAKSLKLAQMYFREGEWDKALAEQGKLLNAERNNPDYLATVGDIYTKKKSIQLAFEFYNKAVPFFLVQGRAEDAISVYQKIIKLDPDKLSLDVRMDMNIFKSYVEINDLLKEKRYEFAAVPLGKLLKLRPQDPMALALLKALGAQVDKIAPSAPRYQTLGDTFMRNGLFENAWEMYRRAAELDPQLLSALPELIKTFQQQGHTAELKKAYLYLAEKALAKEDMKSAMDFAQKAVELKSLEAGYILGLIHFKNQKWNEAKTELEKLLRIKVNHLSALMHLAKAFTHLGQPDKAKENYLKALKIDEKNIALQEAWVDFCLHGPDKEAAIPQLAFLLDRASAEQNTERIIRYSRLSIEVRPDLVSARIKLIEALQAAGNTQDAADACRSLAMVYEQQGLLNDSAEWLKKANHMNPENRNAVQEKLVDVPASAAPLPPEELLMPEIPDIPLVSVPEPLTRVEESPVEEPIPVMEPIDDSPIFPEPIETLLAPSVTSAQPVKKAPTAARTASASSPQDEKQALNVPNSSPTGIPDQKGMGEASRQVPPPIPIKPSPLDEFKEQLATAQICIKQNLIKAAIDIYLQILDARPDLTEVRHKLNDANALYLKQWMEKKK